MFILTQSRTRQKHGVRTMRYITSATGCLLLWVSAYIVLVWPV